MKKIAALAFLLISILVPTSAFAATLALSPNTGTINPGCQFSVKILLDTTGAKVDGVDVILKYDPSRLIPTVQNGSIFPSYPLSNVDPASAKISISGVASVGSPYTTPSSGPEAFATVNFTVATQSAQGPANVAFDFDPANTQKTTDSNVIEDGTTNELLNAVTDGNYTVGTGNCNQQTLTTTTIPGKGGVIATPSATATPGAITKLPVAGFGDASFGLVVIGGVLTVLGVVGLALI